MERRTYVTFGRRWTRLAGLREEIADIQRGYANLLAAWRRRYANAAVELERIQKGRREEAAAGWVRLIKAEGKLREQLVEQYKLGGDKAFPHGMQVKECRQLGYDQAEALVWARQHDMCLLLDKDAFEKLAAARPAEFPFVSVATEPKAFLPRQATAPEPAPSAT